MADRARANGKFVAKDKPATSTGFGESRIFAAEPGTYEPNAINWDELTLGGMPIAESQRGLIPYDITDQGRAEKEAQIEANGGRSSVEFLGRKVELPGGIDERGRIKPSETLHVDGTRAGADMQRAVDYAKAGVYKDDFESSPAGAMIEAYNEHVRPDQAGKFLSPRQIKQKGLRGYEIVKDAKGEPVKVDEMVLGVMPQAKAEGKRQFLASLAHAQMNRTQETVLAQSEQIASKRTINKMSGGAGGQANIGLERYRGEASEMDDRDFNDRA